ncbi:hypothetical protein HDU76_001855 [Blyttiomyces sp. JEL0837]|nr:hypothetical protein HDU76_001855 [Blyttiomyces sp. JEL0837]
MGNCTSRLAESPDLVACANIRHSPDATGRLAVTSSDPKFKVPSSDTLVNAEKWFRQLRYIKVLSPRYKDLSRRLEALQHVNQELRQENDEVIESRERLRGELEETARNVKYELLAKLEQSEALYESERTRKDELETANTKAQAKFEDKDQQLQNALKELGDLRAKDGNVVSLTEEIERLTDILEVKSDEIKNQRELYSRGME